MSNAYLERQARQLIGEVGKLSEKKLARKIGARLQPNSGSMESAKGDMVKGDFLIEAKSTIGGSIGLRLDWLLKIAHEARHSDKTPAVAITFTSEGGSPRRDGEWVAVPLHVWKEHCT